VATREADKDESEAWMNGFLFLDPGQVFLPRGEVALCRQKPDQRRMDHFKCLPPNRFVASSPVPFEQEFLAVEHPSSRS